MNGTGNSKMDLELLVFVRADDLNLPYDSRQTTMTVPRAALAKCSFPGLPNDACIIGGLLHHFEINNERRLELLYRKGTDVVDSARYRVLV